MYDMSPKQHTCRRCGYHSHIAKHLQRHLEKEIPCEPVDSDHFIPREVLLEELKANKRKYTLRDQQKKTLHQQEVARMAQKIARLQSKVNALATKRDECFYQNWLEQWLGGSHCKLQSGVTDITTDTCHAEIKEWKNWKEGVGQLLAYNSELPRQEVALYLFGVPVVCDLSVMVHVFQKAGITHVYQLEYAEETQEVQTQPLYHENPN